jgi:hypothetical protein
VPNIAVVCSSLISRFPGTLFRHCLSDFGMIPVVPVISGTTFAFTFHMRCDSVVRSLYFAAFWTSFLVTFLSPQIATSINTHVPFSLSRILISGLWLWTVLSICTCWFQTCFYNWLLVPEPTNSLHKIQCMTSIKLLHVTAPGCHPQAVFQNKTKQVQQANLGMRSPHWNDWNINILKYARLISIKLQSCDIQTVC